MTDTREPAHLGAPPPAPDWFRAALAVPTGHTTAVVDGAMIHALSWGRPGRRGLVFVHGGGANAYWWHHVAARFADQFRVLALDLSGHGDSDHRDRYALEQWTDEILAIAAAGEVDGPPVVIGHSMGGFVAIAAAARHAKHIAGTIVCDSPVTEPDPEIGAYNVRTAFGAPRTYATVEEALARYRTVPPQARYLDFVVDHVARNSLRPVEGGYRWKFDRRVFEQFTSGVRAIALPYIHQVGTRFALLRSENGLVTPDLGDAMFARLGRNAPVVELPQAGHHAMLDEPLILLTALRTLLSDWDHSEPHRRTMSA